MYEDLKEHLLMRKNSLVGEWVLKKSSYENDICKILSWKLNQNSLTQRYWDAEWKDYRIEMKKGKSIWFDLVRYAEILMGVNENANKKTITIFFVPKKKTITKIISVETDKITKKLLNKDMAKKLLKLKEEVPRQLNAQASLTLKDVRSLSFFEV